MSRAPVPQRVRALVGLRELLLNGAFAPGERLPEIPLGERLSVSRTPLRLAMVALEHEGLLEVHRSGGFRVRTFTVGDAVDAIEVRGVLEGTAARLAAERGVSAEQCAALREVVDELDELVMGASSAREIFLDYVVLNERLHRQLLEVAASSMLARSLEHVGSLPFASPNAFVEAQADLPDALPILVSGQEQHRAIVESIEARAGTRAEHVAREHARLARRTLEAVLHSDAPLASLPGGALLDVSRAPRDECVAARDARAV